MSDESTQKSGESIRPQPRHRIRKKRKATPEAPSSDGLIALIHSLLSGQSEHSDKVITEEKKRPIVPKQRPAQLIGRSEPHGNQPAAAASSLSGSTASSSGENSSTDSSELTISPEQHQGHSDNLDAARKPAPALRMRSRTSPSRTRRRQPKPLWGAPGFRLLLLLMGCLLLLSILIGTFLIGHAFGAYRGAMAATKQLRESQAPNELSPDVANSLDLFFEKLRSGFAEEALQITNALLESTPTLSSLHYMRALAATQAGDRATAIEAAELAIASGQRVSDSKALLAHLFDNTRADKLLEEAVAADPANPAPFLELANRQRSTGDNRGAARNLRSARLRLLPVEAASVVEVAETILQLEDTLTDQLPSTPPGSTLRVRLWAELYLALRRGESETAQELVQRLEADTQPDLFDYLLNDPAFRIFRSDPALQPYFR